jgi:hypothetical protein
LIRPAAYSDLQHQSVAMVVRFKGVENGGELLGVELDWFQVSQGAEDSAALGGAGPPEGKLTVDNGTDDLMDLAPLRGLGAGKASERRGESLDLPSTKCCGRRTSKSSH